MEGSPAKLDGGGGRREEGEGEEKW